MDTADKTRCPSNYEATNADPKEWFLASSQSHNQSVDLRQYQLEWSIESSVNCTHRTTNYGSCIATIDNQKSNNNNNGNYKRYEGIGGYTLYDNISYADSPLFSRSRKAEIDDLRKISASAIPYSTLGGSNNQAGDEQSSSRDSQKPGKFRIFLAFYLLLGITLAIYSRSTLSLAAVAMLANNQMNTELIALISSINSLQQTTTVDNFTNNSYTNQDKLLAVIQHNDKLTATTTRQDITLDGTCPLNADSLKQQRKSSDKTINNQDQNNDLAYLTIPKELNLASATREQLEKAVKDSIQQRVQSGQLVDWTPGQQGMIFAAGSLGNLLSAIPITRLGELYGSKWVIFTAITGASLQAALMPLVSPAHVSLVFLFQLIFNGLTYGADCVAYTFFAHWLTPTEMSFFVSSLILCYQSGIIFSNYITSKILAWGYAWSWCFYIPAILCGSWALLWIALGASDPMKSYIISRKEQTFLQRESKIARSADMFEYSKGSENRSVSWLKLAKDTNIWAIIAVKFTLRWHFSVFSSLLPTYLSSITHMSIENIGKLSVFQSSLCLSTGILMGWLTKSIVSKRPCNLSLATVRKIFQSVVNFGLAISMFYFITFDCNQLVTIISLTIGGLCVNFYVAAAVQLPLDLSPHHCGLITSVSNTLALGQALGAPVSGLILNYGPKDRNLWRIVWGISIVLNTLSGLLFIILVDSKPKDYNKSPAINNDKGAKQHRETSSLLAAAAAARKEKNLRQNLVHSDFQRVGTVQFYSR